MIKRKENRIKRCLFAFVCVFAVCLCSLLGVLKNVSTAQKTSISASAETVTNAINVNTLKNYANTYLLGTQTKCGVTISVNDDGSVHVSGTPVFPVGSSRIFFFVSLSGVSLVSMKSLLGSTVYSYGSHLSGFEFQYCFLSSFGDVYYPRSSVHSYTLPSCECTSVFLYFLIHSSLDSVELNEDCYFGVYTEDVNYYIPNEEGYRERVYKSGQTDGYEDGKQDGYSAGEQDGYDKGYESGEQDGYAVGEQVGYNRGYERGVDEAGGTTFFSLIMAVVDAPVKAFMGLLNFEVFGVDMSAFVLMLLTFCFVIAIVRRFI